MNARRFQIFLALCFGVLAVGGALATLGILRDDLPVVQAGADGVLTVCETGPPDCEYSVIQDAVNTAEDGDLIKVAAGVYTDVNARPAPPEYSGPSVITQVVFITKSITIRGGYTTTNSFADPPDPADNVTILDAQGRGRVMAISGQISPIIEGVRITGGDAAGLGGYGSSSSGGGIHIAWASAIISNCVVHHNVAEILGGGLYLRDSESTIFSNTIANNVAGVDGGGIYLGESSSTIFANTIENNIAGSGGGLSLSDSSDIIQDNTIFSNTASPAYGGGLAVNNGQPTIRGNLFLANVSDYSGAGMHVSADAIMDSNVISGNLGIGLYLHADHPTLLNNLIVDNRGHGIHAEYASAQLIHNTLARNSGNGINVSSSQLAMSNTILVSHTTGVYLYASGVVTMEGTLWGSGIWSNGSDWDGEGEISTGTINLWADPAFVAPDTGNYHIGAGSAARDAAIDTGVGHDIDGQVRPMGWLPDIGADEFLDVGLDLDVALPSSYVNRGTLITYTVWTTSAGSGAATGVILTDTLDPWQRATEVTASLGSCSLDNPVWGGYVTCVPSTIAEGESVVITLTAEVSEAVPFRQAMINSVQVASNETAKEATITSYAQDCHVRLNDTLTTFTGVQTAVDIASEDDLVKIAGTCVGAQSRNGEHQQVMIAKSLTVQGGYTTNNWVTPDPVANPTVLDALGQGRVVTILGEESQTTFTVTLQGLWILGGDVGEDDDGGGIRVQDAAVTIQDNWVYSNTAEDGGGVYLDQAVGALRGNVFQGNHAYYGGGGFVSGSSEALIADNTFLNNSSDVFGGGGVLYGSQALGNLVLSNTAMYGGGFYFTGQDSVLQANILQNNHATNYGGGIAGRYCSGTLAENSLLSNSNHGVFLQDCSDVLMHNNLIADSTGIGVWVIRSQLEALHTTLARNDSYGLYVFRADDAASTVSLTNTVLVSHTTGVYVGSGSSIHAEGTLWGSGTWANVVDWSGSGTIVTGTINYWDDPGFVAPDIGDYHIGPGSAAIDAGVDAGVTVDIDGDTRPIGFGYDIGADEFNAPNPVQAGIEATPTFGLAPLTVYFTNTSTGDFTTSLWSFGDSFTSTQPSPTHTYSTRGTYSPTLTVSGPGGTDTISRPNFITVYEAVQAGFTASPTTGLAPLAVSFVNTSTGDYTNSLWCFGDGVTSTEESPTYIYDTSGVFTVTLTVSGSGGNDTEEKIGYIDVRHGIYLPIILRNP